MLALGCSDCASAGKPMREILSRLARWDEFHITVFDEQVGVSSGRRPPTDYSQLCSDA